ncbi:MAG: type II toxin-antitoxin system Phd/YefM family antitoxin [Cardiobacteriaceae bacterium]|nr:type II toxin-antitoxin system Phd/YefM family antitoxin [Cardiobacteriaceae bacterium]
MHTITSSQAQNNFGAMIDKAQREIISLTKHGQVVAMMMSPEVLQDYIDGVLAEQVKQKEC